MTKNSFMMFEEYALPLFKDGMKVLEIGATPIENEFNLEKLVRKINVDYSNADINGTVLKFRGGEVIDADNNTYDVVFCANVIEHIARPWIWLKELVRVTKKGGKVIVLCPITWGYHESPLDCWRIYPDGMRVLLTDSGLSVELVEMENLDETEIDCLGIGVK